MGAPEPLLLIPGIGCDDDLFTNNEDGLVVLADATSIASMADAILAVAPCRFALLGHSMGGYVALAMVARAPERVTRLALVSTSGAPEASTERDGRMRRIAVAVDDFAGYADKLSAALLHRDHRADCGLVGRVRQMLLRNGPARFERQMVAALDRPDACQGLTRIDVPTLVLTGADDRIIDPVHSEQLFRSIRGSQLVVLDKCGHLPMIERPAQTDDALRTWLERS